MPRFLKGDSVTTKVKKSAFYSGYAGLPYVDFTPGMVGVVGDVSVGKKGRGGFPTRYLVDFTGPFMGDPRHNNTTWRVSLHAEEMKRA